MKLGYAITGSFCTHKTSIKTLSMLVSLGHEVVPILSETVQETDTRFGRAEELIASVTEITGRAPITSIADAEPLGPAEPLSLLIIAPCTGNTLAKMANGITDTAVTMAAKAHLRQDRPLLIALCTNDAMSASLGNLGRMLLRRSVYFLPMKQDDPVKKPHSLVADFSRMSDALAAAVVGKQLRPLFL